MTTLVELWALAIYLGFICLMLLMLGLICAIPFLIVFRIFLAVGRALERLERAEHHRQTFRSHIRKTQ